MLTSGKSKRQLRRERAEALKASNRAKRAQKKKLRKQRNVFQREQNTLERWFYESERTLFSHLLHDFRFAFNSGLVVAGCLYAGFSLFRLCGFRFYVFGSSGQAINWIMDRYISITHVPILSALHLIDVSLPSWTVDSFILWFALAGLVNRGNTIERGLVRNLHARAEGGAYDEKWGVLCVGCLRRRMVTSNMIISYAISLLAWPIIVTQNVRRPYLSVHSETREDWSYAKLRLIRSSKFRPYPSGYFVGHLNVMAWHLAASLSVLLALIIVALF